MSCNPKNLRKILELLEDAGNHPLQIQRGDSDRYTYEIRGNGARTLKAPIGIGGGDVQHCINISLASGLISGEPHSHGFRKLSLELSGVEKLQELRDNSFCNRALKSFSMSIGQIIISVMTAIIIVVVMIKLGLTK